MKDNIIDLVYDRDVRKCLLNEVKNFKTSMKIATFHFGIYKTFMPYIKGKEVKIKTGFGDRGQVCSLTHRAAILESRSNPPNLVSSIALPRHTSLYKPSL